MTKALTGVRILDFTHVQSGPTCTQLLAWFGADVIKVERPGVGDITRGQLCDIPDVDSLYFTMLNHNKRSITLDTKNPKGKEVLEALVKTCDVLVENFAPGVIGSMGLDYQTVSALNPRIIMCSISALGQTGPLALDPGFDYIGQAYAGITSLIGEEDGPPYMPMVAIGDVSTGVHAMGAIACALLYREKTGEGQYIDISLLDSYFHCQTVGVELYSASGGQHEVKRSGLHHPFFAPAGTFKGHKWYIIILAWLDQHWVRVCEAMGRPELATDPRYADAGKRGKHRDELIKLIENWLAAMPSDEASIDALRARRVPVAPILSVAEAMNHPHLIERGTIRKVNDRILGEFQIPGFPLRFSKFPEELEFDAPFLGEHNEAVLARYLGYSRDEVSRLTSEGVLHSADH
jgi:crotonobetainyl-CoA:carnitine CoA-transferase CaiB-like acyl-CoA transferase